MYQIGIDIGGTNVKIGLLDETLELTAEASIPFPHTTAVDMAKKIRAAVLALLEERNASLSGIDSLGAVVPGSIDAIGPDRLIFGTDFPMWSPKEELNRFFSLGLSESDQQKILYGNFMKLLGLRDEE